MPVAAAEFRGVADAALLLPAEAAAGEKFAPRRLAEFTAGRLCARSVLGELGVTGFAVTINRDRTPRWPPGVVASISHTDGFGCAVGATAASLRSIGVDVETVGRVSSEIEPRIFTTSELAFLATLSAPERERAATVIFSAKEAFYKCQYPIAGRWYDFHAVRIELAPKRIFEGEFIVSDADAASARSNPSAPHAAGRSDPNVPHAGVMDADESGANVPGPRVPLPLRGRFRIDGNLALTGIALRHDIEPAPPRSASSANAAPACSRSMR